MPIKVACQCGAKFSAKDELAGKRVKCPKCAQPLTIPAPQAPAAPQAPQAPAPQVPQQPIQPQMPQQQVPQQQVPQQPMQPQQPQMQQPQMPAMSGGLGNLLDEAGVGSDLPMANVPKCPSCGEEVPQGAVICVKCGFNSQTGQTIQTHVDPDLIDKTAHLSDAEKLIKKAEEAMKETPMEIDNYGDGWDSWFIAAGLGVGAIVMTRCVLVYMDLFSQFMAVEPNSTSQAAAKYILIGGNMLGLLVMLLTWVRITGNAFADHKGHGVACLTTFGIYSTFYCCWRWDKYYVDYIVFMTAMTMVQFSTWMYYDTLVTPWENYSPEIRVTSVLLWLILTKVSWACTMILIANSFKNERKKIHGILSICTLFCYAHIYGLIRWTNEYKVYITLAVSSWLTAMAVFIARIDFEVGNLDAPFPIAGIIMIGMILAGSLTCYSCWVRTAAVAFQNPKTTTHGILTLAIPGTFYTPVFAGMQMKTMMGWFIGWIVGFLVYLIPFIIVMSSEVETYDDDLLGEALAIVANRDVRGTPAIPDNVYDLQDVVYNPSATANDRNRVRQQDQQNGITRDDSYYDNIWTFDVTYMDPTDEESRTELNVQVVMYESWSIFGTKLSVHPITYE